MQSISSCLKFVSSSSKKSSRYLSWDSLGKNLMRADCRGWDWHWLGNSKSPLEPVSFNHWSREQLTGVLSLEIYGYLLAGLLNRLVEPSGEQTNQKGSFYLSTQLYCLLFMWRKPCLNVLPHDFTWGTVCSQPSGKDSDLSDVIH